MRLTLIAIATVLLFAVIACKSTPPKTAKVELRNAQGEVVGNATVTEEAGGAMIHLEAKNLPPGVHGIHVHSMGVCEGPDFSTAGGHFNPENKKHGAKNPQGPHAGDLSNITVAQDGTVKADFHVHHATMDDQPGSLFYGQGTALVIHGGPDDEMTDPSGNSGPRIACGVIKKP
jgi:Cu-Zn family superoxide dismutase